MFPSVATIQFAFLSVPTVQPWFLPHYLPVLTGFSNSDSVFWKPSCLCFQQGCLKANLHPHWHMAFETAHHCHRWPFTGPPTYTHRTCFLSRCLERSSFSQESAQTPPSLERSLNSSLHPNHNYSLPPLCSDNSYPILTLLCGHFGYSPISPKIKKLLEGRKGSWFIFEYPQG